MAAFVAYAMAFPDDFLALIDTYDVEQSGIVNFSAVALALHDCGFTARGVRIDSGDLAYLSLASRAVFEKIADSRRDASGSDAEFGWMRKLIIVASNDINEDTLISLKQQQHAIDAYGIGTHLVTCQKQPALGCVFKLVECNGEPRMKLSQVADKVTLPFKKNVYRLYRWDFCSVARLLYLLLLSLLLLLYLRQIFTFILIPSESRRRVNIGNLS